ncbi:MAG: single-stranded DNA-binding protein [Edaphobacter sp.]
MQTQQTITLFGTVSNSATSRSTKNGRKYTAFGVSIISDRNLQAFSYNVVAWGKEGHFAKSLQKGTRIKLVVQAQSQPDNIASIPLLTATFVRPVRPIARGMMAD